MGRLFLRIFLWFWLGSTCLFLGLGVAVQILQPDILAPFRFIQRSAMVHVGNQVVTEYENGGESRAALLLRNVSEEVGSPAWLYDAGGRLLAGPPEIEEARDLVSQAVANEEAVHQGRLRPIALARRIESSSGKQYVLIWESPFRFSRLASRDLWSIRILVLVVTGGIVCGWLTWQITKPIRTLRATTARFAQGDLTARVGDKPEFRRRDEMSELARGFDDMAARIEHLMKSQQQLLADISHELRSPLARLSLALDLARRRLGEGVPEHQRMEREIRRLNELIEQVLMLARLREQSRQPQAENVNVRDLVSEVAADAGYEAEAAGRKVVVARACDAIVQGSRALLRSALENVVRNALRYTPESSEVSIEMERVSEAHRLRISVRDHGPGVPSYALDRLFDPFFRVDEGRDRKSGGAGLGLAITRQAILTHGGTVIAQNHSGGGLLIRLELPLS